MRSKYTKPLTLVAINLYSTKGELIIPEVQRDIVWTKSQNQLLIDSLLKDYDIPKVYFRDRVVGGKTVFDVIDGQQRIHAIISFLNDEFALPADSDKINGIDVSNKLYSELPSEVQIEFSTRTLDVVHLVDYDDDEIDETFLRLQNGTPLKAAEKRRAIQGNMRNVIKELSTNSFFDDLCDFDNSHFNYEDVATKVLKQIKEGSGSISAKSLSSFYEKNASITKSDSDVKKVQHSFNFLLKAFKGSNPHLKKFSALDLPIIVNYLLNTYDLNSYPKEFGNVYSQFLNERALNAEKDEDEQDPKLAAYSNAARGDSLEFIEYRQNYLKEYFIQNMTFLVVKDPQRSFTDEQRAAIYRLGGGVCAICKKHVEEDEDYHADHIIPHSKGGQTKIANAQLLCSTCNLKKNNKV